MEKVLEVKNLTTRIAKGKETLVPISGITFHVNRGETVGLVGESGCGKSITINSIMRLLPEKNISVTADSIKVEGEEVAHLPEKEFCKVRGKQMAMIFQEPMTSLNPALKIGFQIAECVLMHTDCTKREAQKKVREILVSVGITDADRVANSYPHNLSGGMRQRVVIAMAIVCHPTILLADEPTTALDVTIQAQILRLMKTIQEQADMGVVLVTHDLGVVAEQCDRIIIMYCGEIVEEADTITIFTNPKHPYTKGLIACIPRLQDDKERLEHIDGTVLNIRKYGNQGCRFAVRCKYATEKCRTETPPLRLIDENHSCRCWLNEGAEG